MCKIPSQPWYAKSCLTVRRRDPSGAFVTALAHNTTPEGKYGERTKDAATGSERASRTGPEGPVFKQGSPAPTGSPGGGAHDPRGADLRREGHPGGGHTPRAIGDVHRIGPLF